MLPIRTRTRAKIQKSILNKRQYAISTSASHSCEDLSREQPVNLIPEYSDFRSFVDRATRCSSFESLSTVSPDGLLGVDSHARKHRATRAKVQSLKRVTSRVGRYRNTESREISRDRLDAASPVLRVRFELEAETFGPQRILRSRRSITRADKPCRRLQPRYRADNLSELMQLRR